MIVFSAIENELVFSEILKPEFVCSNIIQNTIYSDEVDYAVVDGYIVRITEDEILRITEDQQPRLLES